MINLVLQLLWKLLQGIKKENNINYRPLKIIFISDEEIGCDDEYIYETC